MSELPIDLLHWAVAASPIIVLLVLLTVLGWKAPEAGPVGMFVGAVTALTFFRAPLETLAAAVGSGVWDAVFILLVVWPALLLYRVTDAAGGFSALRIGIRRFSRNHLFLVLAFGWVFASFLQGIAGFGTPIAVVAPLLVAIGVKPVFAVVIPLIGHAWANMFGTLAVGWLATLQVVDLEDELTTAVQTAVLLWIPNILGAIAIAWLFGRGRAILHGLPFIAVISLIQGGGQLGIVFFEPILSTFLASTVALIALYPLSRWSKYRERADHIENRPAMEDDARDLEDDDEKAPMSFTWSLLPYGVLSATSIIALAIPPVKDFLGRFEFGPSFAESETGYGFTAEIDDPYSPIALLTHPGTFLLIATAVTWAVFKSRGYYDEWQKKEGKEPIWKNTAEDAVPASIAIISFLVLAKILDFSGQIEVLALGIAEIAPPLVFAVLANAIGVLGAFMTSSNTASNVLFSQLQLTVADSEGLAPSAIIAAQSTGGAVGNAIAPANIVLGTTTAGIVGKEGAVLRYTLPWVAIVTVIVGFATLIFV
jgi:lactate permease